MTHASPPIAINVASFAIFGAFYGVWQVLLPEISRDVAPGTGELGLALSLGFVGSLPAMLAGGRLADRYGPRALGIAAGLAFAASGAAFALVGGYAALVVTIIAFTGASGAYDVAINAAAIDWEAVSGRRSLTLLHASFSGGAAIAAAITGVMLAVGAAYRPLYVAAGLAFAAVMLAWWWAPSVRHVPGDGVAGGGNLFVRPLFLAFGLICALGFFVESALESWSAIYLRAELGLPVLLGSAGVAFFHGAMFVGRLGSIGVQRRIGRRRALLVAGVALAGGMVVALATDLPALVIGGLVFVGLAVSGVAPAAFSLAGDAAPGRSGQASAVVTVVGYGGFLVAPGAIGGLAELTGLGAALSSVIVGGLLITAVTAALSRFARRPHAV